MEFMKELGEQAVADGVCSADVPACLIQAVRKNWLFPSHRGSNLRCKVSCANVCVEQKEVKVNWGKS